MMRKVIVATLALSPMLLHAQASSPAQPQTSNKTVLQSKLVGPREFRTPTGSDLATTEAPRRTSTGVTPPKLIHTVTIQSDADAITKATGRERTAVIDMVVDESGKPTHLKMLQSAGQPSDEKVLTAVSQYVFKPGTLDGHPAAVPVKLEVVIRPVAE